MRVLHTRGTFVILWEIEGEQFSWKKTVDDSERLLTATLDPSELTILPSRHTGGFNRYPGSF